MVCTICGKRCTMAHYVCILGIFIGIVLVAYASYALQLDSTSVEAQKSQMEPAPSSVIMTSLIFRHGDRTPTSFYKNDPHKDYNWPGGHGALTKKGIQQLFNVGQKLHIRYKTLLPEKEYLSDEIHVLSSAADRCISSGQAFIAGFLPPPDDWVLPIKWQPVPVKYFQRLEDSLLAQKKPCTRYDKELNETYKNETILEDQDMQFDEFYSYLSEHTGDHISNKLDVELLYNTLEIERDAGLTLPEWTQKVFPKKMLNVAMRNLALLTNTSFMRRIKGGSLVADILNKMQLRVKGSNLKAALYSAHDVTLVNFLRAIGYTELIKPEYGATIAVELHFEPNTKPQIQVLYFNNSQTVFPTVIPLSNCGTDLCALSAFINNMETEQVLPISDWEKECKLA